MKTLLSIDWDFFFPIPEHDPNCLYDWGHREDQNLFYGLIWSIRAADFLRFRRELPATSGEEKDFWNRFHFKQDATLFYAESHSLILQVIKNTTHILNFDAHHDAGYSNGKKKQEQGCDNWVLYLPHKNTVRVIYPSWKFYAFKAEPATQGKVKRIIDDGKPIPDEVDTVFVCRSGAWVPGWLDDDFDNFLDNCPVRRHIQVGKLVERKWDDNDARQMSKSIEAALRIPINERCFSETTIKMKRKG